MEQTLTISVQDYLKHIYELTEGGKNASTNALAEKLDVKPASVTVMVQKLAITRPALVEYKKHQGVTLTEAGRRAALEVIRHHRLLETWLVRMLGYSWDEVHEEAERLEHAISEDLERRMAEIMGNPLRDPHGELIPTAELKMPPDTSTPLSTLRPNQTVMVQSVRSADADLLRHLESLGIVPGAWMDVWEYSSFDHNLTIKIGTKTPVLGPDVTGRIFVEVLGVNLARDGE